MINNNQKGLTLIEVLVVVSLVVGIFIAGSNVIANTRESAISKSEKDKVIQFVKETQSLSISAQAAKSWGIKCDGNNIMRFNYVATETPSYTETYVLPANITCLITGSEIRFTKLLGYPVPSPASLTLIRNGEIIYDIEINSLGAITEN